MFATIVSGLNNFDVHKNIEEKKCEKPGEIGNNIRAQTKIQHPIPNAGTVRGCTTSLDPGRRNPPLNLKNAGSGS